VDPLRLLLPALGLVAFYAGLVLFPAKRASVAPSADISQVEDAHALAEDSRALFNAGKWQAALAPSLRLKTLEPRSHILAQRLALIAQHLHHPEEEARWWEDFMRLSTTPEEACPRIGFVYRELGKTADSLRAFERCLAINPNDSDSLFFLGLAYERSGEPGRARRFYSEAAASAPDYPDVQVGLARLDLREGHPDESLSRTQRVLQRHPENTDALLVAGLAALRLSRLDDAKKWLTHASSLSASDPDIRRALSKVAAAEREHGAPNGSAP
jgi:tetratricopeptide (TPR) repeat protein